MDEPLTSHDWDVVIVGAGPVGGHTANLLSKRGQRVLLLEEHNEIGRPFQCAGLVDEVRTDISPKKGSPDNWLKVMEEALSLGLTTSATNVFGFGENLRQRVEHMAKIRDLQDSSLSNYDNGFTSFIAWPVQLETNSFGKRNRGQNKFTLGAGPTEYIRHIAISRLFFDNISSIQASWPTMGLGIAQMALLSGANDAGSTMMEENVVSASGTSKISASYVEFKNIIFRAGLSGQAR